MGLLKDDEEWKKALRECFRDLFVPVTELFATILSYCSPSGPKTLWKEHRQMMIDDIRQRFLGFEKLRSNEDAEKYVLAEIQKYLDGMARSSLNAFELPLADPNFPPLHLPDPGEDMAEVANEVREKVQSFNQDQRQVFNEAIGAVLPGISSENLDDEPDDTMPRDYSPAYMFFLDAPGGTGKTYVTKTIQKYLRKKGKETIAVATSAVATQLLDKRRNAHSKFKIPIPCTEDTSCYVDVGSDYAESLKSASLIIWDEIIMIHKYNVEAVDRLFRDIMSCNMPFGGKALLIIGDFRQILPIVKNGNRGQIVASCIKRSNICNNFKILKLNENMWLSALQIDPNSTVEALTYP